MTDSSSTAGEGKVSLNLKQLSEDDSRVVVRFEICDTGLGIDEDVLPTLFTPFKQASAGTAREYGGSGLGLSITKNVRPPLAVPLFLEHMLTPRTFSSARRADGRRDRPLVHAGRGLPYDDHHPLQQGARLDDVAGRRS